MVKLRWWIINKFELCRNEVNDFSPPYPKLKNEVYYE